MPIRFVVLLVGTALAASGAPARAQAPTHPDSVVPLPPIVTVARAADTVARLPYAVGVLRGADIDRAGPGTSLAEALALVPGITAQNRYNPAQDERIAIRGFGARSAFGVRGVRILLDGIPQTLPDGQGQLNNVDLRRIGRIEVLRGASSALYGNASGGVVSLWSRAPVPGRAAPDARVFVGTDGLLATDAGVAVPAGAGWVAVTGSRVRTDGFRTHSAFETRRGSARVGIPAGSRTTVLATVHVADTPDAQDPGGLTAAELERDPTLAAPANVGTDARKDVVQAQAGVTVRHAMRRGGSIEVTGFGIRRDLDNVLSFATITLGRWAYGARAVATVPLPLGMPVHLTVGADAQWQRDDRLNRTPDGSAVTVDQRETVRELGPFVQVRAVPVPRLTFTAGVRLDAIRFAAADRLLADGDASGTRTMSAGSATAGVAIAAAAGLSPYASVGTAFEAPTTTELANRPDGSQGFNPDLDPQRATQVEVGVRGGRGRLTYDLAAFTATIRDALILFEDSAVAGRQFFRNAGRTRHRGLEARVALDPFPGVRIAAAYTLLDLEFVSFVTDDEAFDGNRLPGVPLHAVTAAVQLRRGPVHLHIDLRGSSAMWADDANAARSPGWWTGDVRLAAEFALAGWRVSPYGGIQNVWDDRHVEAVRVNAGGGRYFEPAAGRRVFVGMQLGG